MGKAYCFSNSCIEAYLLKHNEDYISLDKEYKQLNKKFQNPKNGVKSELAVLKQKIRTIRESSIINNGALIEGDFEVGDDCPHCKWSLKVGDGRIKMGQW